MTTKQILTDDATQYAYSVPYEELPELLAKAKATLEEQDSNWNRAVVKAIEGRVRAVENMSSSWCSVCRKKRRQLGSDVAAAAGADYCDPLCEGRKVD